MRITFGLGFDTYQHPQGERLFDANVVGENGLLGLLEERLGIAPPPEHVIERLGSLMEAIEKGGEDCYFAASFKIDPIGTAKEAMHWLDDVLLGGSAPLPGSDELDSPRLQSLCRLAQNSAAKFGHGGRIQCIVPLLGALDSPAAIGIDEVRHVSTLQRLPYGWESLLKALGAVEVDEPTSTATKGSDLAQLAGFLADPAGTPPPALSADGSLRIVTATSETALADHLATSLAQRDDPAGLALVSGADDLTLDGALLGRDLPPFGSARGGTLAAPGQLLGLALDTLWDPFDPIALLVFLHHPFCPVQWHLRQKLIHKLERTPGWPSDDFAYQLDSAIRWIESGGSDDREDKKKHAKSDLAQWVCHRRFPQDEGVPPDVVADVAARVASTIPEREVGARKTALGFARLVQDQGAAALDPQTLKRLLSEIGASYAGSPPLEAALGCPQVLGNPEFAINSVDEVVWWGFVDDAPPARPWWTEGERRVLEGYGYHLRERIQSFPSQVRPFLAATKSLTLYVPKTVLGEATQPHPLLDRLAAAEVELPVADLDDSMASSTPSEGLVATTPNQLPQRGRWWHVPGYDLFGTPERGSFTTLSKLVGAPQDWVLESTAKLHPGSLAGLSTTLGAGTKGTLIHRAAERFLPAWKGGKEGHDPTTMDEAEITAWVAAHWPEIVGEEAALLLHEGLQLQSTELRHITELSLCRLTEILREFNATEVSCEQAFFGDDSFSHKGMQIGGYVDILARRADGSLGVIDLKLGGVGGRHDEIKAGRHLQLAIYAKLATRGEDISAVPTGYFLLANARLVCTEADAAVFGNEHANTVKPNPHRPDLEAVWQDFEKLFDWRHEQLAAGRMELPIAGTAPDEEPPVDGWFPKESKESPYTNFRSLYGWLPTE